MSIENITKRYGEKEEQEKHIEEYIKAIDDYIYKRCGLFVIENKKRS